MIERYLNPEINSIWDDQNKFDTWKLVQEKYVETLEELDVAENGIAKKRMKYMGLKHKYPLGGDPKFDRRVEIEITYIKK